MKKKKVIYMSPLKARGLPGAEGTQVMEVPEHMHKILIDRNHYENGGRYIDYDERDRYFEKLDQNEDDDGKITVEAEVSASYKKRAEKEAKVVEKEAKQVNTHAEQLKTAKKEIEQNRNRIKAQIKKNKSVGKSGSSGQAPGGAQVTNKTSTPATDQNKSTGKAPTGAKKA